MKIISSLAASALATLCMSTSVYAEESDLLGWTEGAQVLEAQVTEGRIDTISNVIYSQIRSTRAVRQLRMSLMVPRNTAKKPAIIYFPGGGFTSADHEKFTEMRYALARAGFVVAAAEYRVVPNKFPALVEDGKAAVRYLRAHAEEYGIDPARIGVIGDSAGGYLVQMLGTTSGEKGWDKGDFLEASSDVQAVVSLYGISDLRSIGEGLGKAIEDVHLSPAVTEALLVHGPAFNTNPGKSIFDDPKAADHASAVGHVDGTEPPFLLLHGSGDKLVSPKQSAKIFELLRAKNVDVEYKLYKDADHGGLVWFQQPVIDLVVDWFEKKLGRPAAAGEGAAKNL